MMGRREFVRCAGVAFLFFAAALAPLCLDAMPKASEIKSMRPIVNELMESSRKKKPAETAKAALKFASEANSEAAKLLLYVEAFKSYCGAKDWDGAADVVETMFMPLAGIETWADLC